MKYFILIVLCLVPFGCGPTYRQITSDPPGASIYFGRSEDKLKRTAYGLTPYSHSDFGFLAEGYFQVRKDGYHDSELQYCPGGPGNFRYHFTLEPENASQTEVVSSSNGAVLIEPSPQTQSTDNLRISKIEKELQPMYLQSQKWAVIIGISEYKYAGRNDLTHLIFADDDAKAFARLLRNLGWNQGHMRLLVNEEATQRNIIIALESWLTKAGSDDQVVLFWSGHGFPDPEDPEKVYFVCYDTDISIPATGYRMDRVRDALEERRTRNVVVFADTCHAGKLITRGEKGISIMPKIDQMSRENRIPKGWIFMAGADTDRKAIEHTSWRNGAFTHCLLNALSGKADGYMSSGAKDGIVTMGELRAYMNSVMPDETQKVIGVAKRPVISTSTGDPEIWKLSLQDK
jgi:hypothetical protein